MEMFERAGKVNRILVKWLNNAGIYINAVNGRTLDTNFGCVILRFDESVKFCRYNVTIPVAEVKNLTSKKLRTI